jgi:hypothetical protein
MEEIAALRDEDLERITSNIERNLLDPWEMRRLVIACRIQRRVLRHLFGLFINDEHGLRSNADSLRTLNLTDLKRETGLDDTP